MTRKHFETIAQGFANARPPVKGSDRYDTWMHAVAEVAAKLAGTNPAFSFEAFKGACETLPFK